MKSDFLIANRKAIALSIVAAGVLGLSGCGGGSGSSGGGSTPGGVTGGEFTMSMKGGDASNGSGGDASTSHQLDSYRNIEIRRSGTVDTSFSVPSYPVSEDLGTNGVTVSSNTEIISVTSGNEPATPGTLYLVNGEDNLCVVPNVPAGDTCDNVPANIVTGLKIDAGVVVTLGLNRDSGNSDTDGSHATGQDTAEIYFDNDVIINGILKTAALTTADGTVDNRHGATATDRDKGSVYLYPEGDFVMGDNALLDASGDDATVDGDRGGDGGDIYVENSDNLIKLSGTIDNSGGDGMGSGVGGNAAIGPNDSTEYIDLETDGVFINSGSLLSNGGTGSDGGDAGYIYVYSEYGGMYNTGAMQSKGGTGLDGDGGDGAHVYLEPYYSSLYNSGMLDASGGNGTANGGDAGYIDMYGSSDGYAGHVVNSGDLIANGGSSTADGDGGDADYIYLETNGGDLRTSGTIMVNGGKGMGVDGDGGDAGYFELYADTGDDYEQSEGIRSGDILVTGNIELNGGSGVTSGGDGGYLEIDNENDDSNLVPSAGYILLANYNTLNMSGGNGTSSGGDGGEMDISTEDADQSNGYAEVGSIIVEADLVAVGGTSTAGDGGDGGYMDFESEGEAYEGTSGTKISGNVDVSGGNGESSGGDSGGIWLFGHDFLTVTGDLTANGGDANGTAATAGQGAYDSIELYATMQLTNSGTITANGGNGTGTDTTGYSSYELYMWTGDQVTNSGDISMKGGASTGTADNTDGGYMDIWSQRNAAQNTGTLSVVAGTGGSGAEGSNGTILFDNVDVTPSSGVLQ